MKSRIFREKLFASIGRFFNFKRPEFTELDFIDLVVDDKPLLLLVWKSKNAHKLKIKSYRCYRKAEGSVVILLSPSTDQLTIYLKSSWRSKRIEIDIVHTELDERTASFLLQRIKQIKPNGEVIWKTPLSAIEIKVKEIAIRKKLSAVEKLTPALKKACINVKGVQPVIKKGPTLIAENFKYTNNTEQNL